MKTAASLAILGVFLFVSPRARADGDETPPPPAEPTPPAEEPIVLRPDEAPPKPPQVKRIAVFRLDAGFAPRRLFDIPVYGGEGGFGFAFEGRKGFAVVPGLRAAFGKTENGLGMQSGHLGVDFESLGPVRVGVGFSLFLVTVGRAARDSSLISYGHSFRGYLRIDLTRSDGFALFARGSLDLAHEFRSGGAFWGGTIGLGLDFDLQKRVQ
jgi:hypothetical protein